VVVNNKPNSVARTDCTRHYCLPYIWGFGGGFLGFAGGVFSWEFPAGTIKSSVCGAIFLLVCAPTGMLCQKTETLTLQTQARAHTQSPGKKLCQHPAKKFRRASPLEKWHWDKLALEAAVSSQQRQESPTAARFPPCVPTSLCTSRSPRGPTRTWKFPGQLWCTCSRSTSAH